MSKEVPQAKIVVSVGPLGKAPAGSSVVWYGVHVVEMLERLIGIGAKKVFAYKDPLGIVGIIEYSDGKRGVVHLNEGIPHYAVFSQGKEIKFLNIDTSSLYRDLLKEIKGFLEGKEPPVPLEETLEIQAILNAIEKSADSGKEQILENL